MWSTTGSALQTRAPGSKLTGRTDRIPCRRPEEAALTLAMAKEPVEWHSAQSTCYTLTPRALVRCCHTLQNCTCLCSVPNTHVLFLLARAHWGVRVCVWQFEYCHAIDPRCQYSDECVLSQIYLVLFVGSSSHLSLASHFSINRAPL
eukprot:SAG31_NODE_2314_length_5953_cov_1.996413_1_plen_147_part_00